MDIQFIEGKDIDKVKWNSCVHYANNGNIFGYKWYLDQVAREWDALVEGDYESVFPLIWRRNFLGRLELYQPELMRETGVYTINAPSSARLRRFLEAIPERYRKVDITLNEQNIPPAELRFRAETLSNHQLLLHASYEVLQEAFSAEWKEKISRAEEAGLYLSSSLKPETVADFYRKHTKGRQRDRNFHALQRIMYNALHRGWGFASGAYLPSGELLAVNFFLYSHAKVLSLAPVESPEGSRYSALVFLFDLLLHSHAGRPLVLDFNSGDPALAKGFGAVENRYYRIRT